MKRGPIGPLFISSSPHHQWPAFTPPRWPEIRPALTRLCIPGNVSLLHLPPYSPELNPVEAIWEYLRGNTLSNRVFANYDAVVDACCNAWTWLMEAPDRIQSIATRPWVKTVMA